MVCTQFHKHFHTTSEVVNEDTRFKKQSHRSPPCQPQT